MSTEQEKAREALVQGMAEAIDNVTYKTGDDDPGELLERQAQATTDEALALFETVARAIPGAEVRTEVRCPDLTCTQCLPTTVIELPWRKVERETGEQR